MRLKKTYFHKFGIQMKKLLSISLLFLTLSVTTLAQEADTSSALLQEKFDDLKGKVDGIEESFLETRGIVNALAKIKVSGYVQSQFQSAETDGAANVAGGNFPAGSRSRFMIRRGRIKFNYDNDLTQYVMQFDVTQGGFGIKDMYLSVKEPWLKTFSLTSGIFDRPFGYEISYSSSSRETPERSRLFQTLFPGEREIGAKIEIAPPTGALSFLNIKAGIFNGVLNNANENDNNKDFIGRVGFSFPFDEANLSVDGGVSAYLGKVALAAGSSKAYKMDETGGVKKWIVTDSLGDYDRTYLGADLEVYYDLPVLGGLCLRGEYISGKQPGTSGSSQFYNPSSPTTQTHLYAREFSGFYVNYIQNIGLSNQFILKYDVYDPNTKVEGSDIGAAGANLNTADIKYSTLGIGWIYHWDANVKFTLYYDMVKNESVNANATGSLAAFKDDIKDNVLTFRIQYKF